MVKLSNKTLEYLNQLSESQKLALRLLGYRVESIPEGKSRVGFRWLAFTPGENCGMRFFGELYAWEHIISKALEHGVKL